MERERSRFGYDGAATTESAAVPAVIPGAVSAELPPPPVVTEHEISIGKKKLKYFATTGMMPYRNPEGVHEANFFYTAYTVGSAQGDPNRPLTFCFNGGPGSASVWLHLGGLGPKRVVLDEEGWMPQPPFHLVDNEFTWLDKSDLVFIDPVGTGYSRATKPELTEKFHGVEGDIESVAEIIRLYLVKNGRWTSPLYLSGESYGTTRAAGLAGYLVEKGVALNGILLISMIFNFLTHEFHSGNDLPTVLFLPTYAATAWYHQQLPADLQAKPLKAVLAEVEQWTGTDYVLALLKGDALQGAERVAIVQKLARYTGLSETVIEQSNLRIDIQRFCKELMRDDKRTVGRLDSRYIGIDALAITETSDYDPSLAAIRPPYSSTINPYLRFELGYENDDEYKILNGLKWNWGSGRDGYPNTSEPLRAAFSKNQFMKVYVALGYYDLATPYFAARYTLDHLGLDPSQRDRIVTGDYEVGHMVYVHMDGLKKLKTDFDAFVADTLPKR
jgi:carboxypeptidase C (cathepsin A)